MRMCLPSTIAPITWGRFHMFSKSLAIIAIQPSLVEGGRKICRLLRNEGFD